MLKRFFDRQAGPAMQPPTGPALTEDDLKVGLLREVDLFAGLTPAQLKQVSQALPMQTCVVGALVTSPDDDAERLYIVKRGRVRLYRLTPDGKQLTLEILDKGRIVGRMSWLGQELSEVYAEAVEEALICSFTPEELRRLIDRFPAVGVNIIATCPIGSPARSASGRSWPSARSSSGSRRVCSTSCDASAAMTPMGPSTRGSLSRSSPT